MSNTVGQQMREAREARSLSIDQAATATRIKPHYLEALESGQLESLPSMAHARGFLRAYAGYLGLDGDALLTELDPNNPPTIPIKATANAFPTPEPKPAAPPAGDGEIGKTTDGAAAAIFSSLGEDLRQQREQLGLSLEDVERHTHLREHYLVALESGDLDGLPSPVQGRGMLKNYATFLGMNPDPLLLQFAEGLQTRLAARQAAQQPVKTAKKRKRRNVPRGLRRLFSGDVLIGGALTLALGLFVLWIAVRIYGMVSEATPSPTSPSIAEVLLATATATPTYTPESATPTLFAPAASPTQPLATDPVTGLIPTSNPSGGVEVNISVRQRAWMRVNVDGEVAFDGRVIPGSAYPFTGENTVEVLTGSGSSLQVFLNGVDQGVLGQPGEITGRIYSAEGLVTPTPSITPTQGPTTPPTPNPPAPMTPPASP